MAVVLEGAIEEWKDWKDSSNHLATSIHSERKTMTKSSTTAEDLFDTVFSRRGTFHPADERNFKFIRLPTQEARRYKHGNDLQLFLIIFFFT